MPNELQGYYEGVEYVKFYNNTGPHYDTNYNEVRVFIKSPHSPNDSIWVKYNSEFSSSKYELVITSDSTFDRYPSIPQYSDHGNFYDSDSVLFYTIDGGGFGPYETWFYGKKYKDLEATSVNELANTELSVYPNPVQKQLFISSNNEPQPFEIFNAKGAVVEQGIASQNTTVDVSLYKTGVYFVKLGNQLKKFVKE